MRLLPGYKAHYIVAATAIASILLLLTQRTSIYQYLGPSADDNFDTTRWGFQLDMPWYALPEFDEAVLAAAPHHWRGAGHETYATFFASRDASMSDPYFLAAQQIIYRVLWDPKSRSRGHPMTVFVAPFVSQQHRDFFIAAGAIVRELSLHPFVPDKAGAAGRLKDMFAKLEMWRQMEFSKIAYMDSDAFTLTNVDNIFDFAEERTCIQDLLPPADLPRASEICQYSCAGYNDLGGINAGVLIFSPNVAMYNRLIRESLNQTNFDNGFMEQALLQLAYNADGPFPPSLLPHAYNGGVDTKEQGKPLYIVHHKLWATGLDPDGVWWKDVFNQTWIEMLQFYKSSEFRNLRLADDKNSDVP